MKFSGQLFTYDQDKRLTAFEIGPNESTEAVVFIGGLGDGYNAVPFLEPLVEKLVAANWSFIQAELSSSFGRYGTSNLQTDSEEMDTLISYLIKEKGKTRIVVLGHSTGCQDSYWHNKHGVTRQDVAGYILQAPVSDREHFGDHLDNFQHYVQLATNMRKEGKGGELLPIACFSGDPVTADRFYSLSVKGYIYGISSFFSTPSCLPSFLIEVMMMSFRQTCLMKKLLHFFKCGKTHMLGLL